MTAQNLTDNHRCEGATPINFHTARTSRICPKRVRVGRRVDAARAVPMDDRMWIVCELVQRGQLDSATVSEERGVPEGTARSWLSLFVEDRLAVRVRRGRSIDYVPLRRTA